MNTTQGLARSAAMITISHTDKQIGSLLAYCFLTRMQSIAHAIFNALFFVASLLSLGYLAKKQIFPHGIATKNCKEIAKIHLKAMAVLGMNFLISLGSILSPELLFNHWELHKKLFNRIIDLQINALPVSPDRKKWDGQLKFFGLLSAKSSLSSKDWDDIIAIWRRQLRAESKMQNRLKTDPDFKKDMTTTKQNLDRRYQQRDLTQLESENELRKIIISRFAGSSKLYMNNIQVSVNFSDPDDKESSWASAIACYLKENSSKTGDDELLKKTVAANMARLYRNPEQCSREAHIFWHTLSPLSYELFIQSGS